MKFTSLGNIQQAPAKSVAPCFTFG